MIKLNLCLSLWMNQTKQYYHRHYPEGIKIMTRAYPHKKQQELGIDLLLVGES